MISINYNKLTVVKNNDKYQFVTIDTYHYF